MKALTFTIAIAICCACANADKLESLEIENHCSVCTEGELVPDLRNCSEYYVCYHGKLMKASCGRDEYFDQQLSLCVLDENYICWPRCIDGETSIGSNCSSFTFCSNNEWKEEYCPEGYYYDSAKGACLKEFQFTCWPRCLEGETKANKSNCSAFHQCSNSEWEDRSCERGYYFNSDTKQCELDSKCNCESSCWSRCIDGEISVGSNCSSFSVCSNNEWKEEYCPEGFYFDSTIGVCRRDVQFSCWPRCLEGETKANKSNCYTFYRCFDNEWMDQDCGKYWYYDNELNECAYDADHSCWPLCIDGQLSASTQYCTAYYKCSNNVWREEFCPVGYRFEPIGQQCLKDTQFYCWPRCQDGDVMASKSNCSAFHQCSNSEWEDRSCERGYHFNSDTKQCELDSKCNCESSCQ